MGNSTVAFKGLPIKLERLGLIVWSNTFSAPWFGVFLVVFFVCFVLVFFQFYTFQILVLSATTAKA